MIDDQGWSLIEQIPLAKDLLQPSAGTILFEYGELELTLVSSQASRSLDLLDTVASWTKCSSTELVPPGETLAHLYRRAESHGAFELT